MARDCLCDITSQSSPREVRSMMRSQSLSDLESDRLLTINSQSTCITFLSTRKLPYTEDLLSMCPSHPAQSVVVGPHQQMWCFMVFPTMRDREMAEKQLDCSMYKGGGKVVVNWNRKMVPMAKNELDRSRQMTCLAVHGISAGTSKRDLETAFPGSVNVTIARRGGTAFLQFRDREGAEREFRRAEGVVVRGCMVVVMYSHSLGGKGGKRSNKEDLRGILSQKRVEMEYERKMRDYRDMRLALEDKGSRSRSRSRSRFNMKRRKPCSRSRSRSSISRRRTRRYDPFSTNHQKMKDERWTSIQYKENSHSEKSNKKLRQDVFLLRGVLEDSKTATSLVAVLASSPVKKEVQTPVRSDDRSLSFTLSPSPILDRKSDAKSSKSCQPQVESSTSSSAEYGPLYRMLMTQLVGVGLSGKMAHGRAADIVNVWAETGYKVDQLREVLGKYRGKEEQRKELCRIVKEKCRRKARKMNIDIVAMVDITIAFLLETRVKQEDLNDENNLDISKFFMLSKYLEEELTSLGMKMMSVKEEITKVVMALSKLNLIPERMEAKYICMVGDTQMGGLAEFHLYLEKKLTEVGFNGKYLSPRLAAGLVMEFFQVKEGVKEAVERNKKVFAEVDNCLSTVSKLLGKYPDELQKCMETTPKGFPYMGVVLASRLLTICRMSKDECRVLAREMVGVWVNYGFDYLDIRHMYEKEMLGIDKEKDNISLMGMRRLLHCRLRAKIEQGFSKPASFGFSKLIDLSIFYFENTA